MNFDQQPNGFLPEFNEPNMTPLVDVMLVLIIVLLLASPVLLSSVELDVDATKTQTTEQPTVAELVLINPQEVLWQGVKIPASSLKEHLKAFHLQSPDKQLRIVASDQLNYQYLYQVMSDAQQANITKIQFSDLPES